MKVKIALQITLTLTPEEADGEITGVFLMKERISKKEFYSAGGLSQSGLFRLHNGKCWVYYRSCAYGESHVRT